MTNKTNKKQTNGQKNKRTKWKNGRTNNTTGQTPAEGKRDSSQDKLHREFSMIKYPNKILRLPGERIFTVDEDNLVGVVLGVVSA